MNTHFVFQILGLECAYQHGPVVLRIEKLDIPSGKLIFIVGPSGVGKSTLLETLGLMNNTIHNPEVARLQFNGNRGTVDLIQAWRQSNSHRADLRNASFSFVFQSTNLMPNFTAGENMCMSMLINGSDYESAKGKVLEIMPLLDLDPVIFDRKTSELSGGQRQRLAFVRAFTGQYNVLFGDEPTGNLDENTARKLLSVLKEMVTSDNSKTGIIVSHNMELAEEFADMIIPILYSSENQINSEKSGCILEEHVLFRKNDGWSSFSGSEIKSVKNRLDGFLVGRFT